MWFLKASRLSTYYRIEFLEKIVRCIVVHVSSETEQNCGQSWKVCMCWLHQTSKSTVLVVSSSMRSVASPWSPSTFTIGSTYSIVLVKAATWYCRVTWHTRHRPLNKLVYCTKRLGGHFALLVYALIPAERKSFTSYAAVWQPEAQGKALKLSMQLLRLSCDCRHAFARTRTLKWATQTPERASGQNRTRYYHTNDRRASGQNRRASG